MQTSSRLPSPRVAALVILCGFVFVGIAGDTAIPLSARRQLEQKIREVIGRLSYRKKTASRFISMAWEWEDPKGQPFVLSWQSTLTKAEAALAVGHLSEEQVSECEAEVTEEIAATIRRALSPAGGAFELTDIVRDREANCVGFSLVFFVVGRSVGLKVEGLDIQVPEWIRSVPPWVSHVACLVSLRDGRLMLVDIFGTTEPLVMGTHYETAGLWHEAREGTELPELFTLIRMTGPDGVAASLLNSRGNRRESEHAAIQDYTQAILLDPGDSSAYVNRGNAYCNLGRLAEAIRDHSIAIVLNPRNANARWNRAMDFWHLNNYARVIDDCMKAVELRSDYAEPYHLRARAYQAIGEYDRATQDLIIALAHADPDMIDEMLRMASEAGIDMIPTRTAVRDGRLLVSLFATRIAGRVWPARRQPVRTALPFESEASHNSSVPSEHGLSPN